LSSPTHARQLTLKLVELIDIAEGFLAHLSSEGAILSATIPSYINGEQVEVLVQARQLDDGNPSNDVRVTVRNADGIELGSQHTQVQLLGNAEEIRRALLASVPKEISWHSFVCFCRTLRAGISCFFLRTVNSGCQSGSSGLVLINHETHNKRSDIHQTCPNPLE